ncbi:hypothetical protein [Methylobacterium nodulans]|uniref:Uncharacterized protein n=1 Tax=Methylobacterium nodulans (strain LMG 21967 / CNCM I-2342 / ORS 2060) TaxID=460265 RepID=B8IFD7_METNO|nr:hypothetical protein [Methylobacterium nodulans]ACL57672.1 hypothetical protein Mnod_2716 [Methylobacterium nodulans ORS 2060]
MAASSHFDLAGRVAIVAATAYLLLVRKPLEGVETLAPTERLA